VSRIGTTERVWGLKQVTRLSYTRRYISLAAESARGCGNYHQRNLSSTAQVRPTRCVFNKKKHFLFSELKKKTFSFIRLTRMFSNCRNTPPFDEKRLLPTQRIKEPAAKKGSTVTVVDFRQKSDLKGLPSIDRQLQRKETVERQWEEYTPRRLGRQTPGSVPKRRAPD
jgi:hypothetical protein